MGILSEKRDRREEIRDQLTLKYEEGILTRLEYELLWDLTTDNKIRLCSIYLERKLTRGV